MIVLSINRKCFCTKIKKIFLLFFVLFSGCIQAEEILPEWKRSLDLLNSEERHYLESFFRTMLTQSEGGFVLLGSKPVCEEGILVSDKLRIELIGTKVHKRSVDLSVGYRVWEKHFASFPSTQLIICCKDHADSVYDDWVHLLWINPQKVVEVVQKNLPLFQYVMGPEVTPQGFLNYLADPTKDIPHDYTLTGIFLGFGSQNALYYRRLELIQKLNFSRENLPFKPKNRENNLNIGYLGFDQVEAFETKPSFSFATLSEEFQSLEKMGMSSYKAISSTPRSIPLFAVYKKDQETLDLLSHYQRDQKMIENLLTESNFLEQILMRIFE